MAAAAGACCRPPAMTWAATPDPMADSVPQQPPAQQPAAAHQPAQKTAAAHQPPATSATTLEVPAFGWSAYAERVNGRFAMVGFAAVLLIEALSGDTFLHWAGLVP